MHTYEKFGKLSILTGYFQILQNVQSNWVMLIMIFCINTVRNGECDLQVLYFSNTLYNMHNSYVT